MKKLKLIIAALLSFSVAAMPIPVYADAVITGEIKDDLTLEIDNEKFSEVEILNPGDTWENKITIKNNSDLDYDVSLVEITNNIEDPILYNNVECDVVVNNESVHNGKLSDTVEENWIAVKANSTVDYIVKFLAPGPDMDNSMQGRPLSVKFTFEARIEEIPVDESDENNIQPVQTGDRTDIIVLAVMGSVSLIFFGIFCYKKYKEKKRN